MNIHARPHMTARLWLCGKVRWFLPNSQPGGDRFIQTQSFVSRKHMEIFGFYFPEEVKNWYCDDWMTFTYYPKFFYSIPYFCRNLGGPPRYNVIGSLHVNDPIRKKCFELVKSSKDKICLLYTSPSPRDVEESRMPSSA